MSKTSRTQQTEKRYRKNANMLFKRYAQENHASSIINGDKFFAWFTQSIGGFSYSTARSYKSSLVIDLEHRGQPELAQKFRQYKILTKDCKPRTDPPRTSAQKKKSISEKELEKLEKAMGIKSEFYWSDRALTFLKATLLTGLRPSEWKSAELFLDKSENTSSHDIRLRYPVMKVENGKNTNSRSHGKYRHLGLSNLSDDELAIIIKNLTYRSEECLLNALGEKVTFDKYLKNIQNTIYRAASRICNSGRRITLYSARHQHIADLKKCGYSKAEVAALVGHRTDQTAGMHYGRSKSGRIVRARSLPIPEPSEVARIKIILDEPKPAHKKMRAPGL